MSQSEISSGFTIQNQLSSRHPAIHVTDIDYADDLAVLDNTDNGLQETTYLIAQKCSEGGLIINVKNTKCMNILPQTAVI